MKSFSCELWILWKEKFGIVFIEAIEQSVPGLTIIFDTVGCG